MSFDDRDAWEQRWARALRTHGEGLAQRPASAYLTGGFATVAPGRALDAGCGHGAETMWLAARGWTVTGVDFAATALDHARATAAALGPDVAGRIEWIEADLGAWAPPPAAYDLVISIHVHVGGSVGDFVQRMASAVAAGGTLLLVGHQSAPGQVQVSVEEARDALDPEAWDLLVAEDQGVDAVVRAVRGAAAA